MALPLRLFALLLLTASSVLFSFPLCIVILDSKLHTYLFRTAATRDARMQIGSSRERSLAFTYSFPSRLVAFQYMPVFQLQILLGIIQYIDFRPFPFLSFPDVHSSHIEQALYLLQQRRICSFPFLYLSFPSLPNNVFLSN